MMSKVSSFMQSMDNKWVYLLIAIVITIIYGDSFYYGYVNDDYWLVPISFGEMINSLVNGPHFRPLWYASYIVSNSFIQSSHLDHFINIFLYILSSMLAYKYALTQLKKIQAIFVILLWTTLPWTVFPVVWISQRNDLIMYIFVFSSLLLYSNKNYLYSALFILLSFLGKVLSMFMPLYYVYRGVKEKNKLVIILNIAIFFITFSLAYYGYLNLIVQEHIESINFLTKISIHIAHLVESSITQFVPIPFFVNYIHLLLYILALFYAIKSLRFEKSGISTDLLVIIFLLMLPTAISAELRIVGLESFFILVFLAKTLKIINLEYFIIFIVLLITFNLVAIYESKKKFATFNYDISQRIHVNTFYNNQYYTNKREYLLKIKQFVTR